MAVSKKSFGTCKCGKEIFLYTLENKNGMKAEVMNYGAILVNLFVPDKNGTLKDVVLGFDKLEDYFVNGCFFGSTIGPNANRIGNAEFVVDGVTCKLDPNDGSNNLHSHREEGYHKRYWDTKEEDDSIIFSLTDEGTMGYVGNKKFEVTYTLTDTNQLQIHYHATSDVNTVINPTNHTYFNLDGHKAGSIINHTLQLDAANYTPVAEGGIPTGEIAPVAGTPFDFTSPKVIGKEIDASHEQLQLTGGYDHNWVLDHADGSVRKFAQAKAAESGITMNVYTDLPGVQFYAGNFIKKENGKDGTEYLFRHGFCLETQGFPDAVNKPNFPSVIYGPQKEFNSTTIYEFM